MPHRERCGADAPRCTRPPETASTRQQMSRFKRFLHAAHRLFRRGRVYDAELLNSLALLTERPDEKMPIPADTKHLAIF